MGTWRVTTKGRTLAVEAADQWEAFDALRDQPLEAFGLVVEATQRMSPEDTYAVRTPKLLARWGRLDDAREVIALVVAAGGPDTSAADLCDTEEGRG